MALTHQMRLAAIKWLGAKNSVTIVINKIRKNFNGHIANEMDVRVLNPEDGYSLPPDQFALWEAERAKVYAGTHPWFDANVRLTIRANIGEEAYDNGDNGRTLGSLEGFETALALRGNVGPTDDTPPIEWVKRPHPEIK